MSIPVIRVEVGFQQTAGFATPFQLDNATFGLLDTGTLGGVEMVDLTAKVQAIQITRGRNRQTEAFIAGTATVRFYDPARDLDPLNTDSPYYPHVGPRQPLVVYADDTPIYTGLITDWNIDYGIAANGTTTDAVCADNFTILANMVMSEWTPSAQSSGERIAAVLERPEIEYQGPYYLDDGYSTLGAYQVAEGTNVLQYLQNVMHSELGFLFVDATGALRFRDRYPQAQGGLNPETVGCVFKDDGTGIPYQTLQNQFGDELLFNFAQLQSPAGAPQTASDADSMALYQAQTFSKLDLLNSTTAELANMAAYLVGQYKDPVLRFTGLSVQLAGLTDEQHAHLVGCEISSVASVTKSFGEGLPASVTQNVFVTGIAHTITPGSHVMAFTFENVDQRPYLVLNSSLRGILDTNLVAF